MFCNLLKPFMCVGVLLCAIPVGVLADDCDESKKAAELELSGLLATKLEVEMATFQQKTIQLWREQYGLPALLEGDLDAATSRRAAALPQADLAETAYEEARHSVTVACGDDS